MNYLLDLYIFSPEDIELNKNVLTWPKKMNPIFDQNDEVWIRRYVSLQSVFGLVTFCVNIKQTLISCYTLKQLSVTIVSGNAYSTELWEIWWSCSYSSPATWNSIHTSIKNCSFLYSFKRHMLNVWVCAHYKFSYYYYYYYFILSSV